MVPPPDVDFELRLATFAHVERLAAAAGGLVSSAQLNQGITFRGERVPTTIASTPATIARVPLPGNRSQPPGQRLVAAAIDDHDVPVCLDLLEQAGEVRADVRVGGATRHSSGLRHVYSITGHIEGPLVR